MPESDEEDYVISPEELPRVGQKWRKFGKTLIHIRAIVDDQVVYRVWNRKRQWWHYECEDDWCFASRFKFYVLEVDEHGRRAKKRLPPDDR